MWLTSIPGPFAVLASDESAACSDLYHIKVLSRNANSTKALSLLFVFQFAMGATGNLKVALPVSEEPESLPTEETQLIPASCAQFPGSFAPDSRRDKRRVSKRGGFSDRIYIFLTDGWGDITVWKSVVCHSL